MVFKPIEPSQASGGSAGWAPRAPAPKLSTHQAADHFAAATSHLDLAPGISSPLAAGLAGSPAPASTIPFAGPLLRQGELSNQLEHTLVAENGGQPLLAAWAAFDPTRAPVIFVHGLTGSGEELTSLANRLTAAGRQVLILLYDDRHAGPHRSGLGLAREIITLRRQHYTAGTPLDIVGHSMGGIVARTALNYLAEPTWRGDAAELAALPRGGFGAVRLRSIDTPWDGYAHEPRQPKTISAKLFVYLVRPIVFFLLRLVGAALIEMRGSSQTFEHLYSVPLQGVDFRHHAAHLPDGADWVRSLPELKPHEALALLRFVVSGDTPAVIRLRNLAHALAADARFSELKSAVMRELEAGSLSLDASAANTAAFAAIYRDVMPTYPGSHLSVAQDQPGAKDLVDALTRELGAR